MTEPIGWASTRSSLHYKTVFPDVGMQAKLHKNITKRLQPKEVITFNQSNIEAARSILYRQRVALRLFSGSRLNLKGSTPQETSARLHKQPAREHTWADGFHRENSDGYSIVRSEGSQLLTEASVYGQRELPPLTAKSRVTTTMTPIPGSALSHYNEQLKITERLSKCDPEKVPESKGYVVKLQQPIVYKKAYTEDEIQSIVKRLADYNPKTHPAESKGVRSRPSVVSIVPRQSMCRIKKCTAEEVQTIVERLYTFDKSRWPPESKSRPNVYSGRPVRSVSTEEEKREIATAPAPDASTLSLCEDEIISDH